jgi:hypothetical protein
MRQWHGGEKLDVCGGTLAGFRQKQREAMGRFLCVDEFGACNIAFWE